MSTFRAAVVPLVVPALAAVLALSAGASDWAPGRWAATPEAVARLMEHGRFVEAAALARAIVADRLATLGRASSLTVSTWDPLLTACTAAVRAGNQRCVTWAVEALRQADDHADANDDADIRPALVQLAQLLTAAHRLPEAEAAYRRILTIDERRAGRTSQDAANTLTRLGEFHRVDVGDLRLARTYFDEALDIRQKLFGLDSFQAARSLHNLAILVADLDGYGEALALDERAIAIIERSLPADDVRVATAVDFLGVLQRGVGNYVGARDLHEKALAIREAKLGPESTAVADSLTNLSPVLADLGDEARALAAAERALRIYDQALPDHPHAAEAAAHLAELHAAAGRYPEATAAAERNLDVLLANRPADHPDIGDALQRIARLDLAAGNVRQASRRFRQALDLLERDAQRNSRALADVLEGLGIVALRSGRPREARAPLERALDLRRARYGERHPKVADALVLVAEQRHATGDDQHALELGLRAEAIGRDHLRLMMRALGEDEALKYAARRSSGLDVALAIEATGRLPGDPGRTWIALAQSRALVLDEMTRRQSTASRDGTATAGGIGARLARARGSLAHLTVRSLRGDLTPPLAERLRAVADEVEQLEHELAIASAEAPNPVDAAHLSAIANHLPDQTALVAYAVYRPPADFRPGRRRYLAFVLRSSDDAPVVTEIGDADAIDASVREWKQISEQAVPVIDHAAGSERVITMGNDLRRRVWDPVAARLGPAQNIFIVPAGSLHLVNFSALPTGTGRFLVEEDRVLHYLSAERDLVDPAGTTRRERLLAFGAPDFDSESSVVVPLSPRTPSAGAGFRQVRAACGEALRFEPLPRARDEVAGIAADWRARHGPGTSRVLTGRDASESAVKQLTIAPDVMHLATHAFLVNDSCAEDSGPLSPLLRSGLAFAGANQLAPLDRDDGVLTAVEIASLDLSRTQLVVLSACDTGGGTIQDGEGVLGLRRAFHAAGARTLVMSLWRVADTAAMEWMRHFYRHLLAGRSTSVAVRAASRDVLAAQRASGRPPDPAAWGAFVAAGDWR